MITSSVRRMCGGTLLMVCVAAASGTALAANVFDGRVVYEQHCSVCHGSDGRGELPGIPDFSRMSRSLMQPDAMVFDTVSNGKGGMPAFRGLLEEREILDVIAFLRTFVGRR